MKGKPYNVASTMRTFETRVVRVIRKHLPKLCFSRRDWRGPGQADYIVSNARILATGFKPEWSLDRGIQELIKVSTIVRNNVIQMSDPRPTPVKCR